MGLDPDLHLALDGLRAVRDRLWDQDACLDRLAPGVRPGQALGRVHLHAVRETALGAFLDLSDGKLLRASRAIERVLQCQYREPSVPWSGTFKRTAEEADPPLIGAREWYHYDPNWRQFLGCTLAFTLERHEAIIPTDLAEAMEEAISLCVEGELPDRIPPWYTNPNLMHAWLCGWLGRRQNESRYLARGEEIVMAVGARLDRYGDVDEYNSPTYDGVNLFAVALWRTCPPTNLFEEEGLRLAQAIGSRLSRLYHPGLGAICGPYLRAYGLVLGRYVSLAGLWLALAGADASRVIPARLDTDTAHVHDLYFIPIFESLAQAVTPYLTIDDVTAPRSQQRRFDDSVAVSHLGESWAVGCERGRVPRFAKDQYFPFTAHSQTGATTAAFGVQLGDETATVDALPSDEAHTTLRATAHHGTVQLVLLSSETVTIHDGAICQGGLVLEPESEPDEIVSNVRPSGTEVRTIWHKPEVVLEATFDTG